ncbi:ABC transporter substrate-binding protein [Actinomadura atramentaria]|uniref:ABC transporter substrate-binding protein n=1 Tax=Actinomadura atramentaria TaxID=1990 RepID=UPI0003788ED4|nr:ABC transporter substrate-binding protein [Actinomadura atramentaria]
MRPRIRPAARSTVRPAVAVAACLALASACGGGTSAGQGKTGTVQSVPAAASSDRDATFSWGYTIGATSLDPHRGTSGFDQNWLYPVYDRLVYSAADGTLKPMLATSWETTDGGRALVMKLRENVKFQDGTPLDAAAVKKSLDRARDDDSVVKGELTMVKSVEVVDDHTVKLHVTGGIGALIGSLTDRAGMIISPKAIDGGRLATEPVGAGPYKVVENRAGDRVAYERVDGYWDADAQRVKRMVFRVMGDDQTRLNALRTGELNMALIRQNQVGSAQQMGMRVLAGESPTFYTFQVNAASKPFNDEKVRLALNLAMDRKAIGDGLLEGFCTPQVQPWPATSWAYDKSVGDGLDKWPHDTAKAKSLLAEAGYPNGFSFKALAVNISGYSAIAEALQQQFAQVGVKMDLQIVEAAQAAKAFTIDKTADAAVLGYSPTPDPQGVLDRLLLPTAAQNPGKLATKTLVDLAGKAAAPADPAQRAPFYHQILADTIAHPPAATPICMQKRTEAFAPTVSGLAVYAGGARDFRGVAVAKGE